MSIKKKDLFEYVIQKYRINLLQLKSQRSGKSFEMAFNLAKGLVDGKTVAILTTDPKDNQTVRQLEQWGFILETTVEKQPHCSIYTISLKMLDFKHK